MTDAVVMSAVNPRLRYCSELKLPLMAWSPKSMSSPFYV